MKTLFAAFLLALSGSVSAASVAIKPPVGITGNPASATGWTTATNFVGNFSAASFSGGFTTNVGGKSVVMPASMRMAANAGQFAVNAVRLTPAALLGSAVVAWLLSEGLEYIDGQWVKKKTFEQGSEWCTKHTQDCLSGWHQNREQSCSAYATWYRSISGACSNGSIPEYRGTVTDLGCKLESTVCPGNGTGWVQVRVTPISSRAPTQTTQPATDADFAPLASAPLPDAVASELANKDVALPMENPQFNPPYVDEPLGEPYVDPVTGKRYQDSIRVTPQSDGKTADVQTKKQEVDEQGDPATDPTTGVESPPEKQDDFCKQNPDSLACMEKGEPDELDLETRSIGSMVSPVSVGAAGHCMADKTLAMATMGRSITFTYKPICDLASMVRPLILALAWLLAGWIMLGAVKEN